MSVNQKHTQSPLAQRLKLAIELNSETMKEFAEKTGVPYRTLQDYVASKSKPSSDQLSKLAAFGIDVHWLLTGEHVVRTVAQRLPDDAISDAIFARKPLFNRLTSRALILTNEFQDRYSKKAEKALRFDELMAVYSNYFYVIFALGKRMENHIREMIDLGISDDALIDILTEQFGEQYDTRVCELLDSAEKPEPWKFTG